jgi:hypothetical protein
MLGDQRAGSLVSKARERRVLALRCRQLHWLMGDVAFQAFLSVLNPTLIAVTTVILLLPHPGRLMLGYWLGAIITSVTLALLIVFSLQGSSTVSTTEKTLSPLADIALGAVLLVLAVMLAKGRDKRLAECHAKHSEGKNRRGGSARFVGAPPRPLS